MRKENCEHPELQDTYGRCSGEQMMKCHGEIRDHGSDCEHPERKHAKGECSDEQKKQCHGHA